MQHRVEPTSSNERDLLSLSMQPQFQHTVGSIAHQLDAAVGKPATHQANHLLRPQRHRLVSLAQPFTHFVGRRQDTQERQRPFLLRPGEGHDDGHHEEAASLGY